MENQLWNECDAAKNYNGTLWAIALIGFNICFFRFDVNAYPSITDEYTNFIPLNIRKLNEEDLDYLNVEYILQADANGNDVIRVIKWRLDDPNHHIFILEMFEYISNNNP